MKLGIFKSFGVGTFLTTCSGSGWAILTFRFFNLNLVFDFTIVSATSTFGASTCAGSGLFCFFIFVYKRIYYGGKLAGMLARFFLRARADNYFMGGLTSITGSSTTTILGGSVSGITGFITGFGFLTLTGDAGLLIILGGG